MSCEACGVAGCVGECGAVAGERERTDIGAGLWIVVVGIAFLLCPGCSYTAAANPPPKPPATWPDVAQDALPWTFLCLLAIGWARSIGRNEVRKIVRQELAAERAQVRQ